MSFPFGDRSSFREKPKGKSGDEILDDMLKNIKQRKKEFFESPPKWRSTGMFDDDLTSPGGSRLESHLGDLASRHPELADHFYDFPITRKFGTIPREQGKSEDKKSATQSDPRTEDMFVDDVNTPGGSRLTAHLDDLAARHPEIADHLYDLIPKNRKFGSGLREQGKSGDKKNIPKSKQRAEVSKQPETITTGTQTSALESDVKLRNTVPDMQATSGEANADSDRGQRSQSAPPQAPPPNKQKEEGIRLIPIRTDTPASGIPQCNQQIPRPPSQQHFQQQHPHFQDPHPHFHDPHPQFHPSGTQQHFQQGASSQQYCNDQPRHHEESKGPTVRHIPIYVEGRDEPLLPKDAASTNTTKRGGCQGKTESAPPKRGPPPEEKKEHQQPQSNENHQQSQHPAPTPPPPPQKSDPLALVAEVVKDVEVLTARVNDWTGNSRAEKEYIYLDEMLTRNLLKLDNIETEGREEVRSARREAIKRIQAAISILESKAVADDAVVPVWQGNEGASNSGGEVAVEKAEPMEVDNPAPAEASQEAASTSQHTQT